MSEIKKTDGCFVYQLNKAGANKWFFGVQAGFDDNGNRTTPEELEKVATKMAAVDDLYEACAEMRAAQKEYMADRGNEAKGRRVGIAAQQMDAALAKARGES